LEFTAKLDEPQMKTMIYLVYLLSSNAFYKMEQTTKNLLNIFFISHPKFKLFFLALKNHVDIRTIKPYFDVMQLQIT